MEESRVQLGLDYIDLILIHWVTAEGGLSTGDLGRMETWRAMEEF